jgi:hypothetical protein
MFLTTTAAQRDIMKVALTNQKKLAVDAFSVLKRLGKSERPALEAQGTVDALIAELERVSVGERDEKKYELMNRPAAEQMRVALANWARQALKRSEAAEQLLLSTNVSSQEKAAQALLDQLNDQLSLPLTDINTVAQELDKRPKAEKEGDDEDEGKPATSPAPHRGSTRPPRTIGAKTRALLGRGPKK